MGNDRVTIRLGELGRIVTGKTPSKKQSGSFGNDFPFITPRDLNGARIVTNTERSLSCQGAQTVKNSIIPANSVVVSCIGSDMGKAAIVAQESVTNQQINAIIVDECFDYMFVYYDLSVRKEEIRNAAGGSAQPILNKSHFSNLHISIPPLPEQKAIAHILGSLDDKIELNRRMNATLEGMAQALFKSWFVDFDPVIDNALEAGNPIPEKFAERAKVRRQALANGSANREAAKRFPAAFQHSEELGWIPEGWEIDPLGAHLDVFETGRRPKGGVSKYTSGIPSIGAESIFGIGRFDYGKLKFVPEEFFATMKSGKVESYDVLLYKDGGKPGEFKPRSGMFGEGFPFESFGINEHVFRMRSSTLGQAFLYFQVSSERVFHYFAVRGGKAAIPGINQTEVKSVDFLIPKDVVLVNFNNFCQPIFEKIMKSANQSRMLTKLRDTLLPNLISGELQIPYVKEIAEEAIV